MPTKRSSWGKCNSDSRYTDRLHMQNVQFVPFAKPKTNKEKMFFKMDKTLWKTPSTTEY